MSDFELQIAELKRKIEELEGQKDKKPVYRYSKIRDVELEKVVDIERRVNQEVFDNWFNNNFEINKDINAFLSALIEDNKVLITSYTEEDLKINFIAPLLKKVNFKSFNREIRDFYEHPVLYESDEFIFKGIADFIVSKGLIKSKKPYFFIQEFKRAEDYSNPRPQLLAELISAVELNNWNTIKGAYIIGENWSFVILNKLEKHKYEYFVSRTYNSVNFEDLKGIYNNLLFVKKEIIDMVKRGD